MKIMHKPKTALKKIVPASIKKYEALQREITAEKEILAAMRSELSLTREALNAINSELSLSREALRKITNEQSLLKKQLEAAKAQAATASRNAAETNWAAVFNNTITGSAWLKDQTFSPGRWAAGYQMLYVIYRVLNEMRPRSILELGLGQTTKMISQYAAAHPGVQHTVVEHNSDWIGFYKNANTVPENTEIVQLEYGFAPYKEAESVRVFAGFADAFAERKFDFIMIDAPLGGDMKQYARIDVLPLLPACLCDSFVILLDDTERAGENHTAAEIERILTENNIAYARGNYSGKKDTLLYCDKKNAFLASL